MGETPRTDHAMGDGDAIQEGNAGMVNIIKCLHCGEPVKTETAYGAGGTYWTHADGYENCRPTYAAPNLLGQP